MRVRFLSAAHYDVTEAAQHYTTTNPEAGARFFAELDRTLALISENPRIGHPADAGALAFPLNRFPYDVIYLLRPDEIVVYAIAHHRRESSFWISRFN